MSKRHVLALAIGATLVPTNPAPASVKPCRDKLGRIAECPKARKPSPRCKDARGRFVASSKASEGSHGEKQQPAKGSAGSR